MAMGAGIDMVFSLDVCCLMLLMWRFVLEVIGLIAREKALLSWEQARYGIPTYVE